MQDPMGPVPTSLGDLPPEYVTYNVGPAVIMTSIAMTVATLVLVAVRFIVRSKSTIGLGIDDWLILAAMPLMIAFMAATILAVQKGGAGRHLIVNMFLGMERIEAVSLYLYVGEYVGEYPYFTLVAVIKASILAMYCRIFPTRSMKWGVYILGTTVIMWWIATILVTIFQCQPVYNAYKPFMQTGTCLGKKQLFFGTSIPNVIQDAFILVLPAREVWRLQVATRQRIAILGVFVLGFAVVVIGCISLKFLLDLVHSDDFTEAMAVAWIWTIAEPFTGIIAACLPTLQPPLGFVFKRAFRTARSAGSRSRNADTDGRTAKARSGYAKRITKNSKGLNSFTRLEEGDVVGSPGLWLAGYPSTREATASRRMGRNAGFASDEIPLRDIAVKSWTDDNQGTRGVLALKQQIML